MKILTEAMTTYRSVYSVANGHKAILFDKINSFARLFLLFMLILYL